MSGSEVRLSIIMPTYNREAYIKEALDSILMQESSYPYEIIIADDCSTDKSLEIAQEYQARNPHKIKILTSQSNQKLFKNIVRVYADLKSDYFCVLDPDDFWTDKFKIQKALDFLESHTDFCAYFGNTAYKYEIDEHAQGERPDFYFKHDTPSCEYTFDEFLNGKYLFGHTSSVIYRNVIFQNALPEQLKNVSKESEISYRGDSFRNFIHLQKGKSYYSGELDSVYRIVSSGIWTSLNLQERALIGATFYKDMYLYWDKAYLQMLLFSRRAYREYSPLELIIGGGGSSPLEQRVVQCKCLEQLYQEHKEQLQSLAFAKVKWKYRIYFALYKFLYKKLHKKGLVNHQNFV
ncbi:glycosyltransferase family A protein [Helicobacter sp. MIT 21-1697]|uniref:glycosyltransferase family 2 protein n=1 Tax=Helicobacter sp. MIT 21-1697 TaxID=2993733 RepID=UPI00224B39B8|nr:glycosyltransferase family A protein [Helicobacter sp. MIT 21-1697]MCX2716500.1 glycosyltransferase family A protein [Helicobacter sp. MIT 21-1697]